MKVFPCVLREKSDKPERQDTGAREHRRPIRNAASALSPKYVEQQEGGRRNDDREIVKRVEEPRRGEADQKSAYGAPERDHQIERGQKGRSGTKAGQFSVADH